MTILYKPYSSLAQGLQSAPLSRGLKPLENMGLTPFKKLTPSSLPKPTASFVNQAAQSLSTVYLQLFKLSLNPLTRIVKSMQHANGFRGIPNIGIYQDKAYNAFVNFSWLVYATGFLQRVKSFSALVFLTGHELGHFNANHSHKKVQLYNRLQLAKLGSASGVVGAMLHRHWETSEEGLSIKQLLSLPLSGYTTFRLGSIPASQFFKSVSRKMELEADDYGAHSANKVGAQVQKGFTEIMQEFAKDNAEIPFKSKVYRFVYGNTHPSLEARQKNFEHTYADLPKQQVNLLRLIWMNIQWTQLKLYMKTYGLIEKGNQAWKGLF